MQRSFGKNPFNFAVPDVKRHPMEQEPITQEIDIYDDLEFRADVVDTKSKKAVKEGNTVEPIVADRFLYAPTMAGIKAFDKTYKLPKQKNLPKSKKTSEEIQAEKKKLEVRLAENTQAMNNLKANAAALKKTAKKIKN